MGSNWKSGTAASPHIIASGERMSPQNAAAPSHLTFENVTLDGTIMGFVGSAITDSSFSNITEIHYSDVQDASGNHIGGDLEPTNNAPWTPPPHLFYLVNNVEASPVMPNANLTFTNINDANLNAAGQAIAYDRTHTTNPNRVGGPRDTAAILKAANRGESGYALSLKLMCGISAATPGAAVNGGCVINNYTSHRPDGFMAVQDLSNVTFNDIKATFDSNYTDGLAMYRPGIWFPGPYSGVTFENVTLTDVAAKPLNEPIGYSEGYYGLRFDNVSVYVNAMPTGVDLYDNNLGQAADSTRYYYVGANSPIKVTP